MLSLRPRASEYDPFYAGYVARVPDNGWLEQLQGQPEEFRTLVRGLDPDRAALPLAAGKWSLVETLAHVADTERVFAFRLLWFARGGTAELPGFDQDDWVRVAGTTRRSLEAVLDDLAAVRDATLTLLEGVPDEAAERAGVANGQPVTVRALAWIIAGHTQHHLDGLRAFVRRSGRNEF